MAREESSRPQVKVETYQVQTPARPATMPWWLAGIGGALVAAIVGWALVTALILSAELAGAGQVTGTGMELATRIWLLAHGGALQWQGTIMTIAPLGLTAVAGLVIHWAAGYAGKQARLADAGDGEDIANPGRATLKVAGVVTGVYAATVSTTALLMDPSVMVVRSGLGALVLAAAMAFWGARKAVGWDVSRVWPTWAKPVPTAMMGATLIGLIGGAVALSTGLVLHRDQFIMLTDQLNPGWAGGTVLAVGQLFFIVNLIVWAMSWTFGPGFSLGDDSILTLAGGHVGMLPALPVTAALPPELPSTAVLAWLAVPVLAGVGAGMLVVRAQPRARAHETALVGGLSGVLAGVLLVGLAGLARGDLGAVRLADLGPQMIPLLIIAPSAMGIAGGLTGLIAGLLRRPTSPVKDVQPQASQEDTEVMDEADRPVREEQPAIDFHADKW